MRMMRSLTVCLTIETAGTEAEAAEGLEAALEMEVVEDGGGEVK